MVKFLGTLKTRTWLAIVAALAVLERLAIYFLYRPVSYNDTLSYRRLADEVLAGWNGYDGTRMPGYPVFLAALGPDERVYLVQLALGLLTTLLFFYLGWRVSGKGWFGALAALAHSLNLQQLFFEADLLTETLTTFFVVLALAGLAWLVYSDGKRPLYQIILAGLLTGLAGGLAMLMRALFIFLPFLATFVLLVFWRVRPRLRWAAAFSATLAGLACLAVWLSFMHTVHHMWSLSTVDGYHLMNHTGMFFEYVPDQYAALRETFIQYRDAQIAQTGSAGNAIWDAIPAMEKVSGLSFFDLSRLLEKLSIQLILQHPQLYLRNVVLGWIAFWKVPFHWAVAGGEGALAGLLRRTVVLAWRGALALFNLAFLAGSVLLVWNKARRFLKLDAFWGCLLGTVWLTSIVQTLLEYGDNPRYSVPVQSLVVLAVLWAGLLVLRRLPGRNK
jgi:4-amino-4-deoxy-L-arabinose transferase-like glycosyltransferase